MTRTFMQMVGEAQAEVPAVIPEEARRRLEADPSTLIIDVRDESSIRASGMTPVRRDLSWPSCLQRGSDREHGSGRGPSSEDTPACFSGDTRPTVWHQHGLKVGEREH